MPLRASRHELAGGLAGHVFGKMQSSDQKLMTACYSDWQICQSRTYSSTTTMRAYRNYRQFSSAICGASMGWRSLSLVMHAHKTQQSRADILGQFMILGASGVAPTTLDQIAKAGLKKGKENSNDTGD
jgi:hypothetical protein